ncbi:MAG: sigma-70 family RNA polymerase sigma factor [Myxococcales bacterium]
MTLFHDRRDLLDAFRKGERAAMAEVYTAYVTDVGRLVQRGCRLGGGHTLPGVREPQRHRDLVQEVFVKAFAPSARLAYDGLRDYRPYLLRIARNLLVDEARSGGRLVPVEEPMDEVEIVDEAPEEDLEWRRLRAATQEFCQATKSPLREFIQLRFVDDLSQRDVAEKMGVTRRQVRTWEDQVRADLQKYLAECEKRGWPNSATGS